MPANVHILRGNPSKKSAAELTAGVNPPVEIPGCPKHLLPEAKKEWRRIGPELEALGLISKIDRPALALYCQEWAWLVWHENLLQRDVGQAAAREAAHDAREVERCAKAMEAGETHTPTVWTGGDGFMLPTPNGSFTYNPHWVARNKHAAMVDKFLSSFGMSPSSRGRVSPSSNQLPLFPGAAEDKGGFKAF
jgi:P27 family predicted phage terminase small subunit